MGKLISDACPTGAKKTVFWAVFTLVLLCSVGLSCYRIDEPLWESGHHGFHMAECPHSALNYLRFGYLDTKFGWVMDYGNHKPAGGFSYRLDHPMLTIVLISFAYRVLGVYAWSARLFPVILSVGTSVATFFLALQVSGNRWNGLIAFFLCALSPMTVYYGRMPAPHNLSVFFSVLFFYFYWRWFTTRRSGYLAGIFMGLILGACTDWIIYFAVAPVLVHYLILYEGRRNWWVVIILTLSPVLLFALYVLWTRWLVGSHALQVLWKTFLLRTGSSHGLDRSLTIGTVWHTFYERSKYWLTIPVLVLSVGWLIGSCRAFVSRTMSASQGLILALFVFGFSYNLIFTNLAMVHDFVMLYHLVPVFALASASALAWIAARYLQRAFALTILAVAIILCLYGILSLQVFETENSRAVTYTQAYYLGKALNSSVSDSGSYIDAVDLFQHPGTPRTSTTADRPFRRADTLDEFLGVHDNPIHEAVVVANSDNSDAELRRYLIEHYPRRDVWGYSIFELNRAGSNVLVADPFIENPYNIRFEDQIEFLGFDVDRIVYRRDGQIGWLERYVNRHAELLPRYRTAFRVVIFWRKIAEGSIDYTLVTQFDSQSDQLYRLEQSYAGLDGLYPTSFWPVGQIIRDDFEITVPSDYPALNYAMWVGVENGTQHLVPMEPHAVTDENHRVRVGQVYIRKCSASLSPELVAPVADRPVDVNLGEGLSLVRFRQSQRSVYPGDLLMVTLTWSTETLVDQNYKVFVHMMDSDGHLVAQHDAEPNRGERPTSRWAPGVLVQDLHPLLIPLDLPPGAYRIQAGMYLEATMERLPVLHSSEPSRDNATKMGTVTVLSVEE